MYSTIIYFCLGYEPSSQSRPRKKQHVNRQDNEDNSGQSDENILNYPTDEMSEEEVTPEKIDLEKAIWTEPGTSLCCFIPGC